MLVPNKDYICIDYIYNWLKIIIGSIGLAHKLRKRFILGILPNE